MQCKSKLGEELVSCWIFFYVNISKICSNQTILKLANSSHQVVSFSDKGTILHPTPKIHLIEKQFRHTCALDTFLFTGAKVSRLFHLFKSISNPDIFTPIRTDNLGRLRCFDIYPLSMKTLKGRKSLSFHQLIAAFNTQNTRKLFEQRMLHVAQRPVLRLH